MGDRAIWTTGLPVAAALIAIAGPLHAADPAGLWRSETGKSRYRVSRCGSGICVNIAWIVEGPDVRDEHNPDPTKRNRRVIGIEIVSNAKPAGRDRWEGRIYNFKDGKTYSVRATLQTPDRMRFAACVAGGLLCLTQHLTRLK